MSPAPPPDALLSEGISAPHSEPREVMDIPHSDSCSDATSPLDPYREFVPDSQPPLGENGNSPELDFLFLPRNARTDPESESDKTLSHHPSAREETAILDRPGEGACLVDLGTEQAVEVGATGSCTKRARSPPDDSDYLPPSKQPKTTSMESMTGSSSPLPLPPTQTLCLAEYTPSQPPPHPVLSSSPDDPFASAALEARQSNSAGGAQQIPPSSPPLVGQSSPHLPPIGQSSPIPVQLESIRDLLFRLDRRYPGHDFSRHGTSFIMTKLTDENALWCPNEIMQEAGMPKDKILILKQYLKARPREED